MCQAKCWQNELNGTQLGWWTNKTYVGKKIHSKTKSAQKRCFQEIIGLFIISTGARVLTQLVTVECWSGRRLHQYEWNRWTKHLWFQPLFSAFVSGQLAEPQHLSPGNKFEDENFEWQSQTNRVFWFVSTWNCSCSDGKHRKALQNVPKCNMQSVIVLVHVGNGPSSCIPDSVAKRDVNRLRWTLPKLLTTGS